MNRKNKIVEHRIIFFGETHRFAPKELDYIERTIKKFKPEIILYELLENKNLDNLEKINSFLKSPENKKFSLISSYGELKGFVKLAKKYKLPIIGCDLKNLGRNKPIPINKKLTKKEIRMEEKILKKREKYQTRFIMRISEKYHTALIIVGAYHLRRNSPLRKIKNSKIILPKYKGKEIFSPKGIKNLNKVYYSLTL